MGDGTFSFCRAGGFLNVSACGAFLFRRRHNDNAAVIDRRYRVSGVADARAFGQLSWLLANDSLRSVVLRLCVLAVITRDAMPRDAVRVSMLVSVRATFSAKDVCGCALSLIHAWLGVWSCANRVSAAVISRRPAAPWTNQWRLLVSLRQRHVFPREYAPSLPGQIRPAWVEGDFPSRLSSRARSIVSSSGIVQMFAPNIESGCAMRLSSA